jgi:hypothetical protein
MELLIALIGVALMLSALVLVACYRRRGEDPAEFASVGGHSDSGRPHDSHGPATENSWVFSGGGLS